MPFYSLASSNQFIYHYTKSSHLFDKILPNASLRMGPMACTNDPYEAKDWYFGLGTNNGGIDISTEKRIQLESDATRIAKRHAKLICFTRDNDAAQITGIDQLWERGFCKPRMWEQYAGGHAGACLIFDCEKLESSLQSSRQPNAHLFGGNVTYRNRSQAPPLRDNPFILNFDLYKSAGLEEAVRSHVLHFWKGLYFEKSIDWSQEQEFRWLMWDQIHSDHVFNFADALKGIVVGPKFPQDRMANLIEFQRNLNFGIRCLNWKNGVPELLPYIHSRTVTRV
jgi:hypothetical protein